MKRLYTASNLQDAHIVRGLLGQSGIEAEIFNANAQGGLGEIPFTHAYPEVWIVNDRDLGRARELVHGYEHAPVESGSAFCRGCGEENPANFQLCWKCGAAI